MSLPRRIAKLEERRPPLSELTDAELDRRIREATLAMGKSVPAIRRLAAYRKIRAGIEVSIAEDRELMDFIRQLPEGRR